MPERDSEKKRNVETVAPHVGNPSRAIVRTAHDSYPMNVARQSAEIA